MEEREGLQGGACGWAGRGLGGSLEEMLELGLGALGDPQR